jgi:hypothetical protein
MAVTKHSFEEMVKYFCSFDKAKPYGRLLTLSRYATKITTRHFNDVCEANDWDTRLDTGVLLLDDNALFSAMGFERVDSMDYSEYQGASIIYDLNNPNVPDGYCNLYDFIVDAGTMEHIFNLPNALQAIFKMLKPGGTFFFDQPVFYHVNHGFYNVSPCLYYEYFLQNNWKINGFRLYLCELPDMEPYKCVSSSEQDMRMGQIHIEDNTACLMWGAVTKTENTVCTVIPQQYKYVDLWNESVRRDKKIKEILSASENGTIYFYGTGYHTFEVLENLCSVEIKKIGGLISIRPDEIGKRFMPKYDINIYDISVVKPGDTIIISTIDYQEVVYERIKHLQDFDVRIVLLYERATS